MITQETGLVADEKPVVSAGASSIVRKMPVVRSISSRKTPTSNINGERIEADFRSCRWTGGIGGSSDKGIYPAGSSASARLFSGRSCSYFEVGILKDSSSSY